MEATFAIERYVLDTLMRDLVGHDHRPSAFLVYLTVAAASEVGKWRSLSHATLADQTGLSKRAVQDALTHLQRRGLVSARRNGPTQAVGYRAERPWRRS